MLFNSKKNIILTSIISISLLFSGCAGGDYGQQQTTVNYYAQCYAPISELRRADSNFNRKIVSSTAIGAGLGILSGILIYGNAEGAIAGGLAGAAAGAAIGYSQAKRERIKNDNVRMASYLADIEGDISGLNRATAAARISRQCYDNAFREALAAFKAKKLNKSEFRARLDEIKSGSTETALILGQVITGVAEKEAVYQEAIVSEAKLANIPVPATVATPKRVVTQSPKKTYTTKKATPKKTEPKKPPQKTIVTSNISPTAKEPVPEQIKSMASSTNLLSASRQAAAAEQLKLQDLNREMQASYALLDS